MYMYCINYLPVQIQYSSDAKERRTVLGCLNHHHPDWALVTVIGLVDMLAYTMGRDIRKFTSSSRSLCSSSCVCVCVCVCDAYMCVCVSVCVMRVCVCVL